MTLPISGNKTTFKTYLFKKASKQMKETIKTPPALVRQERMDFTITGEFLWPEMLFKIKR